MNEQQNEKIREIIHSILHMGLVHIRQSATFGRLSECLAEANHLHNLPDLLAHPSIDLLEFYYSTTRQTYLKQIENSNVDHLYGEAWKAIQEFLTTYQQK